MIEDMSVKCHFFGAMFSSEKVEKLTGLTLEDTLEVGEIERVGRYRGTPSTYGSGTLSPPLEYKEHDDFGLEWLALTLSEHIDVFRKFGAEEIDLVIGVFYEEQCNFTLPPNALKLIGDLGLVLQVSCYGD